MEDLLGRPSVLELFLIDTDELVNVDLLVLVDGS